jgi:hypothetical protein
MERVIIAKHALLSEINAQMKSLTACRNLHALDVAHDSGRISGGNWMMQQFRRSGHDHDEAECQLAIGEFIAEMQERFDIVE